MSAEILSGGILTTVQDKGRVGYAHEGWPECGACDPGLYNKANLLAGNAEGEAALEFTALGPDIRFDSDAVIAVMGDVKPLLNGEAMPVGEPVAVTAGSVLKCGVMQSGLRGYIAFHGGIDVPLVMGSRSTDLKCAIGGLAGRRLERGDILPLMQYDTGKWMRILQGMHFDMPAERDIIRFVPGPQEDMFTPRGMQAFTGGKYTVTPDSNRMGVRLSGPEVETKNGADILSDGIVVGSVQITAAGQPIVMLADHQTIGGYAKIGTVIPTDIPVLAQKRGGDTICFKRVSVLQARLIRYFERLGYSAYEKRIRRLKGREKNLHVQDRSEL